MLFHELSKKPKATQHLLLDGFIIDCSGVPQNGRCWENGDCKDTNTQFPQVLSYLDFLVTLFS